MNSIYLAVCIIVMLPSLLCALSSIANSNSALPIATPEKGVVRRYSEWDVGGIVTLSNDRKVNGIVFAAGVIFLAALALSMYTKSYDYKWEPYSPAHPDSSEPLNSTSTAKFTE